MPRSPIRTRRSAIAEYWLGSEEGRARLPENEALIDFGEPHCFACAWSATGPDEPPELWRVWNRAALQRCHLIPAALGGEDSPRNLVLLCARCHSEAPDVGDPNYMLNWIAAHDSWGHLFLHEMKSAMDLHEVSQDECEVFNRAGLAGLAQVQDLLETWAIPVANRFSYATLATCAVAAVRREAATDR